VKKVLFCVLKLPELPKIFSVFLDKSPLIGLLLVLKHLLGDGQGLQHLIGGQHLGGQQSIGGQHLGGQQLIGGQHLGGQGSQHVILQQGYSNNFVNSYKSILPSLLISILLIIALISLSK
jgi:hypothetical protein